MEFNKYRTAGEENTIYYYTLVIFHYTETSKSLSFAKFAYDDERNSTLRSNATTRFVSGSSK